MLNSHVVVLRVLTAVCKHDPSADLKTYKAPRLVRAEER